MGLGLVIDVWIAFLVKVLLRQLRIWGSGKWPLEKAQVYSSKVGGGCVWNCPTTEIAYAFHFNGERYTALDCKPFLFGGTAEDYADQFKPELTAIVRVNPLRPERSILQLSDQNIENHRFI